MLQLQGCHFCTKGCQNPRARGSQRAAARDLPGPIALETCDPATKRTSSNKISEARESASDLPGHPKMDAKQTACYHCKTLLSLPKEHSKYWRCGHCRKVNGRPNYARGFVPGLLYCGLCRFYFSRITNAIATTALVGIVGSGLLFFLPMISRRGRGVSFCGTFASRVASTASSRRESRIDGAEVSLAQGSSGSAVPRSSSPSSTCSRRTRVRAAAASASRRRV